MEVKKLYAEWRYEGSNILFLESRAQFMSLQIWISFFTFVDLTLWEESHSRYLNSYLGIYLYSLALVQKIPFLKMPRWVPFKKYRAKHLEETCNHLNL